MLNASVLASALEKYCGCVPRYLAPMNVLLTCENSSKSDWVGRNNSQRSNTFRSDQVLEVFA